MWPPHPHLVPPHPHLSVQVYAAFGHPTLGPASPPYPGVCLAYFTSGFNTAAVDHEADGSTNNGIFQINSRKWCKNLDPEVPNLCQMYCSGRLGPSGGASGRGARLWAWLRFFPAGVCDPRLCL